MKIQYLGNSGWAVYNNDICLIFDDISGGEFYDPMQLKSSSNTAIFISHVHGDHFDSNIFMRFSGANNVKYILGYDIKQSVSASRAMADTLADSIFLNEYDRAEVFGMDITAYGSTDQGVCFDITLPLEGCDMLRAEFSSESDELSAESSSESYVLSAEHSSDSNSLSAESAVGRDELRSNSIKSTSTKNTCTRIFHAGDLNEWHWIGEADEQWMREQAEGFESIIKGIPTEPRIDIAFFPVDPRMKGDFYRGAVKFIKAFSPKFFVPMHFGNTLDLPRDFIEQVKGYTEIVGCFQLGQTIDVKL